MRLQTDDHLYSLIQSYADGNGGFTANTNRPTTGGGNAFWDTYNNVAENYVTDATTLKLREVSLKLYFR